MKKVIIGFGLFVCSIYLSSTAWADSGQFSIVKCDPTKISKITETTIEHNPPGVETTDKREYTLDGNGNIAQFNENGKSAMDSTSLAAAFIKGKSECAGLNLFSYMMYKRSPEMAKSKSPDFNLQGKWFLEKPFAIGHETLSRYQETTKNGKNYLIKEMRGLSTNMDLTASKDEIDIRYNEIDLSTSLITRMILINYKAPNSTSTELIDTGKSIEQWAADHHDADYYRETAYTYDLR